MVQIPLNIKTVELLIVISILFFGCKKIIDNISPSSEPNSENSIILNYPEDPNAINSNNAKRLLQGKWITHDNDWGLIFKDNKVHEYENGSIQNEGEYILDVNINPIRITILENKKEVAAYIVEFKNNQTLKIEEVSKKNILSFSEECIILTKQKSD